MKTNLNTTNRVTEIKKLRRRKTVSRADLLGREIQKLYASELSDMGQKDLRQMRHLLQVSERLSRRGRYLIENGDTFADWTRGIRKLAAHFMMEFTLGHMILHGAFDDIEGSELQSKTWQWRTTMAEEDWRLEHNQYHHGETNIIGTDHDFGFLFFRFSEKQTWKPWHLFQIFGLGALPLIATPYRAFYVTTARALAENRPLRPAIYQQAAEKLLYDALENFWDRPVKAGVRFPKVLLGNAAARLMFDSFFIFMLAVAHQNEELANYTEELDSTVGEFYLRQILSSLNHRVGSERLEDSIFGAITVHIEHHLFPNLPSWRLRTVSKKVESICRRYGIPYRNISFADAFKGLVQTGLKFSLPWAKTDRSPIKAIWARMVEPVMEVRDGKLSAANFVIMLDKSGITVPASADHTILESLQFAGVKVPNGCKKGVCRSCVARKTFGKTSLEQSEKQEHITICTAFPRSDIVLNL